MADALQVQISSEQEKQILLYTTTAQQLLVNQFSLRARMEEIDRVYMREEDWTKANTRARIANRSGDASKMRDVVVPIVMPQVERAVAYFANVFLTGYPIFGVVAGPDQENAALQMETIIAENSQTARWKRELLMFARDGFKYNLHGLEVDWEQRTTWTVETDISQKNNAKPKKTLWNGNVLKRMDLYNTFFDPRVHPSEIHSEGEYAGYIEIMSRMRMKKYINDLFAKISKKTAIRAFESSPAAGAATNSMAPFGYYIPIINPDPIMDRQNLQTFDWLAWAGAATQNGSTGIKYGNIFQVCKLYARILPADFGFNVPEPNTPQVWKFIIVNGQVVLYAERLTNIHNYIPIIFGQPIEDGLDYQTKSFANNVSDMQAVATSMVSGYMASKRRLVTDRVLYDPTRVSSKDINSTHPAAKIPVRPAAYGKPVGDAVYQFPYHDEQAQSLLQGAQVIVQMADKINGQNPAQQGQFVKGNRTLKEYDDVMTNSDDHNKLMAISIEEQVFTPVKEIIKLNILQYQGDDVLFNSTTGTNVNIKPTDIRKQAVEFKISDGELPVEKLLSGDMLQTAIQVLGSSPQLAAGYNIAPMFSYMMKTEGANLTPFEKSPAQQQFEMQQDTWKQVAIEAVKAGKPPPPQPTPSPELQQELAQKQGTGGVTPSQTTQTLANTQGI